MANEKVRRDISQRIVLEYLGAGKPFSRQQILDSVSSRNGSGHVAVNYTIEDQLEQLVSARVLRFDDQKRYVPVN